MRSAPSTGQFLPLCPLPLQCSVPCGLGQRSREVRCVSNVGEFVPDAECNMNLRPIDIENCDMGPCAKSWFYTEWGSKVTDGYTVSTLLYSIYSVNFRH